MPKILKKQTAQSRIQSIHNITGRAITVFFEKDGSNNTATNFYKPNKKKVEKESTE